MTDQRGGHERFRSRYGPWALITGASDGIGRALAAAVAARGLNVVLTSRNEQRLNAIAHELRTAHGVDTVVTAADLSDPAATGRLQDETRQFDIGLVVLAAGFGNTGGFADASEAGQLEMIAVNITAVTALTHAFAPRLVARGGGGVVLFGSIVGWQGVPGQAVYAATKAYVQTFAEGLLAELGPRGVNVLSLAPGPVHSGFAARAGLTMTSATTADVVAAAALTALGRRGTVVPGARAKLLTAALATLPRPLRTRVIGRVIEGMRTPVPQRVSYSDLTKLPGCS